jgi:predicted lipoprotein with Yx(FWY)xxD motif
MAAPDLLTKGTNMTHSRLITFLPGAAAIPLVALAVAGCGGGATASPAPPKTASGSAATVGVANTGLGKILVDSKGRTLYLFQKDSGTKSTCFGACASDWPPLRAKGRLTVGSGAKASMVGTTTRSDGKRQVTYNSHPLYLYAGDEKAGDTEGQGVTAFGAGWYALTSTGNQVAGQASNSGASSSGGGSGY